MPELPEMEHYRRLLNERLAGHTITHTEVEREKSINVGAHEFQMRLQGRQVLRIDRRAKMLLFRLDGEMTLLLHLMLGGAMFWGRIEEKPKRTAQVTLSFGERRLFFIGLRLGYLHLYTALEAEGKLARLGPEPLAPAFTADAFAHRLGRKRGLLKPALVDQSVLAGIGNCYSDELCFQAGVQPSRRIDSLGDEEYRRLYAGLQSVLTEAIQAGGYMELPLDVHDRITGGYNDRCKVYDRGGEPCLRCGSTIVQSELASRKSFACPVCQK